MKKVNKQCLLDTPRTVRVSEKTCICSIIYVVSAKYQIAPSKALVGVDRLLKALSMHIQKPYKGIIVLVLTLVILSKKKIQPDSFIHMFNVSTLYRKSIKLLHQKLW